MILSSSKNVAQHQKWNTSMLILLCRSFPNIIIQHHSLGTMLRQFFHSLDRLLKETTLFVSIPSKTVRHFPKLPGFEYFLQKPKRTKLLITICNGPWAPWSHECLTPLWGKSLANSYYPFSKREDWIQRSWVCCQNNWAVIEWDVSRSSCYGSQTGILSTGINHVSSMELHFKRSDAATANGGNSKSYQS